MSTEVQVPNDVVKDKLAYIAESIHDFLCNYLDAVGETPLAGYALTEELGSIVKYINDEGYGLVEHHTEPYKGYLGDHGTKKHKKHRHEQTKKARKERKLAQSQGQKLKTHAQKFKEITDLLQSVSDTKSPMNATDLDPKIKEIILHLKEEGGVDYDLAYHQNVEVFATLTNTTTPKKDDILKEFDRAMQTIAWALEPFSHENGVLINKAKVLTAVENFEKCLKKEAKTKKVEVDYEAKFFNETNTQGEMLSRPQQRAFLRIVYPRNKSSEELPLLSKNKPVRGVLAKFNYILNSGKTNRTAVDDRKKWVKKMEAAAEVEAMYTEQAANLLTKLKEVVNYKMENMGPVKLLEGIMLKADRKNLGKDKESPFDWLPFLKEPKPEKKIIMDIKDVIRGSIIFETYDEMARAYIAIIKKIVEGKLKKDLNINVSTEIAKLDDRFVGGQDNETTYRDMKIVVYLENDSKHARKVLEEANTDLRKIPFEIQLNTLSGITIKNAAKSLKHQWWHDQNENDEWVNEKYKGFDSAGKLIFFKSTEFIDDCLAKMAAYDVTGVRQAYIDKMNEIPKDDADPTICDKDEGLVKKAHEVYKMGAGEVKEGLEAVYNKIYEIGFWCDGYHPTAGITHSREYKDAYTRLIGLCADKERAETKKKKDIDAFLKIIDESSSKTQRPAFNDQITRTKLAEFYPVEQVSEKSINISRYGLSTRMNRNLRPSMASRHQQQQVRSEYTSSTLNSKKPRINKTARRTMERRQNREVFWC